MQRTDSMRLGAYARTSYLRSIHQLAPLFSPLDSIFLLI